MKFIPYIRFILICLFGYRLIENVNPVSGQGYIAELLLMSDVLSGLLIFVFLLYLLLQGLHELNNNTLNAPWLRYYGLLFELLNIAVSTYLILLSQSKFQTLIIPLISMALLIIVFIKDISLTFSPKTSDSHN